MEYQTPGLFDGEQAVEEPSARTEILAKAFEKAAGGYFERQKDYEDTIAAAEERKTKMKYLAVGAAVLGVGILAVAVVETMLLVGILGVLVALAGGAYAYLKIEQAEETIKENRQQLRANDPDGRVSFVSRITAPLYLVPYQDRHMIFDGLGAAQETELRLANIDGDALAEARQDLDETKQLFDQQAAGENVMSPEFAEQLSEGVTEHRLLERPITSRIDRLTDIAGGVDYETIRINVHTDNVTARSIRALAQNGSLQQSGELPQMEVETSLRECQQAVDEIRGVEEEAVSGDILSDAKNHRQRVDELAGNLTGRLQENVDTVQTHYDAYGQESAAAVHKHVCEECLEDEMDRIDDELNLVETILSPETGSFGMALSDGDLNRGADGEVTVNGRQFTEHIRDEVEAKIPNLNERMTEAFNTLDDIGTDNPHCQVHGSVDFRHIPDSGALFGEVWQRLYYEFQEPIMETVDDLERDAEEVRQNKEQKMIDLAQYEQIKDAAEREFHAVKNEHETARRIEREL